MRPIRRPPLSPGASAFLAGRASSVAKATSRVAEAKRLWGQKNNKAFEEIRRTLRGMAPGRDRCMYCEDNEGTDIDHFRPKVKFPRRAFSWSNYLWACSSCNSNHKRDQFPRDAKRKPLLIDPTAEDPLVHLTLTPSTGAFVRRTLKGEESIRVFGLNRQTLTQGRKDAWEVIGLCIVAYAKLRRRRDHNQAKRIERLVRSHDFSSVLWHLVRVASASNAAALLDADWLLALRRCPEILTWAS